MVLLTIFNHNAPLLMVYMIIIMGTALIGTYPQFSHNSKRGLGLKWTMVLAFMLALFPIQSGDFVYSAIILQKGTNFSHLELFYQGLWLLSRDLIIWRSVVFGGAILLLISTIQLLNVNKKFACFIFAITEMFMFGAMRNMLGFMLMVLCIALLFNSGNILKRMVFFILAVSGFFGCIFLHRSMPLYIALLPLALIPFGKRTIKLSLFTFPFIYFSVFIFTQWFLKSFADQETQHHASLYTKSVMETTLLKTINDLIKQGCYIYLLSIVIRKLLPNDNAPRIFKFLTRYAFILIYIGFLFYGQTTGGWLYSRFVGAGEVLFMFVMMYFFYYYPRKKGIKIAFAGLIYCIVYQMLYVTTYASNNFIERFNLITL